MKLLIIIPISLLWDEITDVMMLILVLWLIVDTADSVSKELVEADLVDGKDMIVGKYSAPSLMSNAEYDATGQ